jgi:hypothetical protein
MKRTSVENSLRGRQPHLRGSPRQHGARQHACSRQAREARAQQHAQCARTWREARAQQYAQCARTCQCTRARTRPSTKGPSSPYKNPSDPQCARTPPPHGPTAPTRGAQWPFETTRSKQRSGRSKQRPLVQLAVEGRPIYKKIDKHERAGDKNCLEPITEPAWKGHWEELRVDMATALALALLFDALLGETTGFSGTVYGPITLEAGRSGLLLSRLCAAGSSFGLWGALRFLPPTRGLALDASPDTGTRQGPAGHALGLRGSRGPPGLPTVFPVPRRPGLPTGSGPLACWHAHARTNGGLAIAYGRVGPEGGGGLRGVRRHARGHYARAPAVLPMPAAALILYL